MAVTAVQTGERLSAQELASATRALLMLIAANTTPWILARLLGTRLTAPMDFGLTLRDGRRLLGSHKTWRGFLGASAASGIVGALSGVGWWLGVGFGALSMTGDAVSSAVKRRLGHPPGSEVLGIDQLAESLLPLLVLWRPLGIGMSEAAVVIVVFAALDVLSTRARHGSDLR